MKVVGFFGVYQESFKIIQSHTKIFTQITFILILPLLSFIFFIFKQQSNLLFNEILHDSHQLTNINNHDTPQYQHLIRKISSKWDTFLFFNFISFTLILIFSILSTTAIASVVTLLDGKACGFEAMKKSKELVKESLDENLVKPVKSSNGSPISTSPEVDYCT
ncbi:hypothetical protein Ahy_A07g033886 [Arachis hypogaea]|uniref:Transmembrane protein n=1 Tax=Arachis hypogaea TaxID=3818 RepID=A0A445CAP9_ARAHY|nr:hypothetical protein Ahy_A07g033886 [Arachis hypogaea]